MTTDLKTLAIDSVLCISLKEREDRRASLLDSFKNSGLNVEFSLVDRDEEDQQRGCYESHLACARTVLQRGYKRALILEDDCILEPFSSKAVARINRFLESKNPEIFYLGVILGQLWLTWRPGIARCRGQGTHAYIISAQGCRKMLDWKAYAGKAIDNSFSKGFKGYCAFPMMCFQNNEFETDIKVWHDTLGRKVINPVKIKTHFRAQQTRKQYISALRKWYKTLLCR